MTDLAGVQRWAFWPMGMDEFPGGKYILYSDAEKIVGRGQAQLTEQRQLNEDAMHKETALVLSLDEERRIGDWMVENQAVVHGYNDLLFWHPIINPDTSIERTTKSKRITDSPWRKAVLEVMDE